LVPIAVRGVERGCQEAYWMELVLGRGWLGWVGGGGKEMGVDKYPVVCPHVHVHALEADRGRVEVKIYPPEGGAKGVGEAGAALVVEGVGLAEDERGYWFRGF
jgi:hypothetical protein